MMDPVDDEVGRKPFTDYLDSPVFSPTRNDATREEHKKLASLLAFLLVFLVWDTWDSLMCYIKTEAGYGNIMHGLCNVFLLLVSIPIMRRVGPAYLHSKRIVSIASLLSAVGIWDIMDLAVRSLFEPGHSANLIFYATSLVIVLAVIISYENRHDYDIIGDHLINT